ncbi:acyltransferase [Actinoplanes sp. L3-i22]|nr:acyltransferase [Actinoplanes sp. L3-i22]
MSLVARIEAATPAGRDRTVDALRAVAILGVVLGHWLVSAVVSDPYRPAVWHGASPLQDRPALIPVSWVLQTLGLFFFAGGYASARARPGLVARLARLVRPVAVLAAVWLPALGLLRLSGAPESTRRLVTALLVHPLWFLLVFVFLTAVAGPLRAAVARWGLWPVLPLVAVVAVSDVCRHHGMTFSLVTVVGWAVPYVLGIALAEGRLPRWTGPALVFAGVAGGIALVRLAGYPASAVGVPGDGWSNLDPPSLFALALAAAQLGVFLLVRPRLAGWLRRPRCWAPAAGLNLVAMTVYCWHQSALLLVTFAAQLAGRLPGLLDEPTGDWPVHRLLWLPVLALTLAALGSVFHPREHRPASARPAPPARPAPRTDPRSTASRAPRDHSRTP